MRGTRNSKVIHAVLMDNLSVHKGGRVRELVGQRGCELLYLPPYSPYSYRPRCNAGDVREINAQSTLTTVIDGEVIIGFDKEKISEMLGLYYSTV